MSKLDEQVALWALKRRLLEEIPKCFLCKWIYQDLDAHGGKLKGWNLDFFGKPIFPPSGEISHLKLEGIKFEEAAIYANQG